LREHVTSRVGQPNVGEVRRLSRREQATRSTSAWVSARHDDCSSGREGIAGGHQFSGKAWTTCSPTLSLAQGQPQVTPPQAGHAVEAEACSNNIPPSEDAATPTLHREGESPPSWMTRRAHKAPVPSLQPQTRPHFPSQLNAGALPPSG
jgi:hypothetical protein